MRSFLAAGASTVMAAYWPVLDNKITLSMVEKMAKHLLVPKESRPTHAQALQQIVKEMIETYPDNIEAWGVFFLTGI